MLDELLTKIHDNNTNTHKTYITCLKIKRPASLIIILYDISETQENEASTSTERGQKRECVSSLSICKGDFTASTSYCMCDIMDLILTATSEFLNEGNVIFRDGCTEIKER